MLAEALGESAESQNQIYYAALLHDVGKIGVPNAIINKTGKLTDELQTKCWKLSTQIRNTNFTKIFKRFIVQISVYKEIFANGFFIRDLWSVYFILYSYSSPAAGISDFWLYLPTG